MVYSRTPFLPIGVPIWVLGINIYYIYIYRMECLSFFSLSLSLSPDFGTEECGVIRPGSEVCRLKYCHFCGARGGQRRWGPIENGTLLGGAEDQTHPLKMNEFPQKGDHPKRKWTFQPLFFWGHVCFQGSRSIECCTSKTAAWKKKERAFRWGSKGVFQAWVSAGDAWGKGSSFEGNYIHAWWISFHSDC